MKYILRSVYPQAVLKNNAWEHCLLILNLTERKQSTVYRFIAWFTIRATKACSQELYFLFFEYE